MLTIFPYRHDGLWVFDDDSVGLRQEPFVSGAAPLFPGGTQAAPRRIFVRAEQGETVTPRTTPLQSHPPQTPPAAPEE